MCAISEPISTNSSEKTMLTCPINCSLNQHACRRQTLLQNRPSHTFRNTCFHTGRVPSGQIKGSISKSYRLYIAPACSSSPQLGSTRLHPRKFVPPADMYPHERRSLECLMRMSDSEHILLQPRGQMIPQVLS